MAGFFDTLFAGDGTHPKDVAKAYYELNRQLAMDEGSDEQRQWKSLFDSAKGAGLSPAQIYDPKSGGLAVETDKGLQPIAGPQGPTELERWKNEVDGLVQSGNPVLQKEGLSMLAQYRARATQPDTQAKDYRSTAEKMAEAAGYTPGTAEYQDFVKKYALKSNSPTIVMPNGETQGTMLSAEDKARWGLDPRGNYANTKDGPKPITAGSYTTEQAKNATFASNMDHSEQLFQQMYNSNFDPSALALKAADYAEGLSGYILSPSQQVYKQGVDMWIRAKLRKESGAQIGDEEGRQEYQTFFPQPNESVAVRRAKSLARQIAQEGIAAESGGAYQKKMFAEAEDLVRQALEEDKTYKSKAKDVIEGVGGKPEPVTPRTAPKLDPRYNVEPE